MTAIFHAAGIACLTSHVYVEIIQNMRSSTAAGLTTMSCVSDVEGLLPRWAVSPLSVGFALTSAVPFRASLWDYQRQQPNFLQQTVLNRGFHDFP